MAWTALVAWAALVVARAIEAEERVRAAEARLVIAVAAAVAVVAVAVHLDGEQLDQLELVRLARLELAEAEDGRAIARDHQQPRLFVGHLGHATNEERRVVSLLEPADQEVGLL